MIEVLEQSEVERRFDRLVLFGLSKHGCKIDCELLVRNGRFQNSLVFRLEKRNSFLLLLLERAKQSDVAAKIVIRSVAAKLMHKPVLLKLRAVH